MCREDAKEFASRYVLTTYVPIGVICFIDYFLVRFASGEFDNRVKLYGIIKEVAPVGKFDTDQKLGVGVFQSQYFLNNPVYMDTSKKFYSFLGDKSLLAQPWSSWNPFRLYADFQSMQRRLSSKGVEGNLAGEGLLKGGVLLMSPTKGVVYRHEEVTGYEAPYEEIGKAIKDMFDNGVPSNEL